MQLNTIDHHDERKMPIFKSDVKGQIGKCGRIHCRQDTDWTINSRILQLTFHQHDKRKMPIVFQGGWSKLKVKVSHSKKWRQDTEWTIRSRIIQLGKIDHHDERIFRIGGQISSSYCHIVGKCDRIRCRQDTDWTESSRIYQLGKIDHHDKRKMPIVFQDRRI